MQSLVVDLQLYITHVQCTKIIVRLITDYVHVYIHIILRFIIFLN